MDNRPQPRLRSTARPDSLRPMPRLANVLDPCGDDFVEGVQWY